MRAGDEKASVIFTFAERASESAASKKFIDAAKRERGRGRELRGKAPVHSVYQLTPKCVKERKASTGRIIACKWNFGF